jgi:hypothetical protein
MGHTRPGDFSFVRDCTLWSPVRGEGVATRTLNGAAAALAATLDARRLSSSSSSADPCPSTAAALAAAAAFFATFPYGFPRPNAPPLAEAAALELGCRVGVNSAAAADGRKVDGVTGAAAASAAAADGRKVDAEGRKVDCVTGAAAAAAAAAA